MDDKTAILITGTSRGIGRYLAHHYLSKGCHVAGCSRSIDNIIEHPNYFHSVSDISNEEQVQNLVRQVQEKFGHLNVTINSAAINPILAPALLTPGSAVVNTLQTNVVGTFLVSRESAKLMIKTGSGRIITLGSMAVKHEVMGESVYTASKAAIGAFTRVLAKELHRFNITCNVVAPAAVETELMAAVKPEALQAVLERNAIPQIGKMEEISDVIDWLISPQSAAITGQAIYLGGA